MSRRLHLLHPLSEHSATPHNVRDLGLIPINLDRARPQKVRCCMQIQKIRFHVFSSIELLPPGAPLVAYFAMTGFHPLKEKRRDLTRAPTTKANRLTTNDERPPYSIIPARANSAFTAIRCSTLSAASVLLSTAGSSRSPSISFFPISADTTRDSVFRSIRHARAFSSAFDSSTWPTLSCN